MINRRRTLGFASGATALGLCCSADLEALSGSTAGSAQEEAQLVQDIRAWDALGMHRTGSAEDAQTANWLAAEIEQAGASAQIDSLEFTRRVPGRCEVRTSVDSAQAASGLPMFDGAATLSGGITGKAGALGSGAAIGVTVFGPGGWDKNTRELQAVRASNQHQAIIAVADAKQVLPGLTVLNAEAYQAPFGPPVLQVATDAGDWLFQAARTGSELTVHAELTNEHTTISNVQTTIPGRDLQLPPLVIMTPRSGWWTCTSERAGGIALWLDCIRTFARSQPTRGVIFTANTGHELGHIGLEHFLDQRQELIRGAHAWIHLGANFIARDNTLRFQASTEHLMQRGLSELKRAGVESIATTPVSDRPFGEARNIHDGGGQFISLLGTNPWFHHPDDLWPQSVDLDKARRLQAAMLRLAIGLADG